MTIFHYTSYFLISLILYSLFTSPFSPSILPPATFNLIGPHFVSVFPPFRTIQSSILHVLNLLCVDVRKLLSHPFPLTHFPPFSSSSCSSITILSFSLISSFSHLYPYNFSYPPSSCLSYLSPPLPRSPPLSAWIRSRMEIKCAVGRYPD